MNSIYLHQDNNSHREPGPPWPQVRDEIGTRKIESFCCNAGGAIGIIQSLKKVECTYKVCRIFLIIIKMCREHIRQYALLLISRTRSMSSNLLFSGVVTSQHTPLLSSPSSPNNNPTSLAPSFLLARVRMDRK